jgi:phage-related holin
MGEIFAPLSGMKPLWTIVCVEVLIVLAAMSVDFASGFLKARLRGEERTSVGLKRTVSKFILYVGSILIASGVDSIFHMCGFWRIAHCAALHDVPAITSLVAVFVCAVEGRSIWENAERKQRGNALKTAAAITRILAEAIPREKAEALLRRMQEPNGETEDAD